MILYEVYFMVDTSSNSVSEPDLEKVLDKVLANQKIDVDEEKTESPSDYDIFYYYYYILKKICDFKSVNEFFAANLTENQYIFGYIYTVQIMMTKAMNELVDFSRDWNVYTLLHWGDKDLSDPLIQNLKNENPVLKYVYDLKVLRTELSKYLYSDSQPDIKSMQKDIDKVNSLITEINDYLVKEFEVKSVNEGRDEARAMLLTYIVNTCYRPESDLQPVVPGHPQSEGTYKSTYLGNEKLIGKAGLIFNGYKYTFVYLLSDFKNIIGGSFTELTDYIKNAKNAYEIRHGGSEILEKLQSFKYIITFSMGQVVNISKERDIKAEKEGDLDFVFMNRDIRVIRASKFLGWFPHFDLDDASFFFIDTLRGILVNPEAEVELLEITYIDNELDNKGDTLAYSYAIYLLIGNSYANASYWIVFDRIALRSTRDSYKTDSKWHIDNLISEYRDQIVLSKVSVKRDLLSAYFIDKDRSMRQLNTYNEGLKSSNAILIEFLAYLYTQIKYDAKLVGLRVPYKETDIDALSENDEYEFICQAKTTIPITKAGLDNGLDEIFTYFNRLTNRETKKKTKNIVFIGRWSYADDDYLHEASKAEEKGLSLEALRKHRTARILADRSMELVFYEDLRVLLLADAKNNLLVKEFDKLLGYDEYD